jgi:sec-independent protein translocase protein TatB
MKDQMESAARDVENSVQTEANEFEKQWSDVTNEAAMEAALPAPPAVFPEYKHPGKRWRLKQGAVPNWYKARSGVRTKAMSGAARVARHRPQRLN